MRYRKRSAKINVKLLVVLIVVVVALGISLVAARQIRRGILSRIAWDEGTAAFENKDWPAAARHLQEYLGRNPDDVEILKKYAQARLNIRPVEAPNIMQAIAGYRRVLQLDPLDKEVYDELAGLYTGIRSFEELAYIARMRLEQAPDDRNAPLWRASALVQLNKKEEARQTLEKLIAELAALPDTHTEYVQACLQMSQIMATDDSRDAQVKALEWLNKAAEYAPDSVKAVANRTRFYRQAAINLTESVQEQLLAVARADLDAANISAATAREKLVALARKDLEAADELAGDSPTIRTIRYFLGTEWLAHGELELAAAELQAVEGLSQERIEEDFFDINDWVVLRFLLASELATRRKAQAEACSLAGRSLFAGR